MKKVTVFLISIMIVLSWGNDRPKSYAELTDQSSINKLFSLSLVELMNQKVFGATLTSFTHGETPSAVTLITSDQIARSGARSLDELLDIYVPGLQLMEKSNGTMIGLRGIISDRNNKLLMVVNGKPMTIKTREGGASSERYFSMLGDIHTITVIRNPGSAVYGPGAIAGIVSIQTKSGKTHEGLEVSASTGLVEEYINLQLHYGTTFNNDLSLYTYYGIDSYDGAQSDDAPIKFSHSFTTKDSQSVTAGEAVPFEVTPWNESYFKKYRHKAHIQLESDNFKLWGRYTLGASSKLKDAAFFKWSDSTKNLQGWGLLYQQFTLNGSVTQKINNALTLDATLGSQLTHNQWIKDGINFGEYEHYGSTKLTYTPNASHTAVVGLEGIYDLFGRKSPYSRTDSSKVDDQVDKNSEWETSHFALFGEHQWKINESLITLIGGRLDKHTYTDIMASPRASLIFSPTQSDIIKVMVLRSVRKPDDVDIYIADEKDENNKQMEVLKSYEVRYEKQLTESNRLLGSVYYNDLSIVAWSWEDNYSKVVGDMKLLGVDAEWEYQGKLGRLSLSHNYTTLIDYDSKHSAGNNNFTSKAYGYGHDLANWSTHSSKLSFTYMVNKELSITSSLRAYWWLPGGQDNADYNMAENEPPNVFGPQYDPGETRAFEESIYFNLGAQYVLWDNYTFRITGHNLLGFVDEDYNKRNYFQTTSMYRILPPSFSATVTATVF
ncbi:MAG: TonB-dependent receptor plug domain-containing protein [Fibrobacterales bacterium]